MKFAIGISFFFLGIFKGCVNQQPTRLSDKTETIEVHYINWACNCADFLETNYSTEDAEAETNSIFIEPADSSLRLPDRFYEKDHFGHRLRLTGQFYDDKGVPDSYEPKTSEATEEARVFRYTKWELIAN